tara:strand:- start:903 stop:1319 length:417 start_codon:yes stop_codon:yes gene_type:complete
MKWLIGLTMTLLLSSCGAKYHLKRAIKKDPSILTVDTIAVVDTIVTAPVLVRDTITLKKQDTITITKDKLKVKLIRSYDTIQVDAVCESDTIVRVIEVPTPSIVLKDSDKWYNKVYKFSFWFLLLLLSFLFVKKKLLS